MTLNSFTARAEGSGFDPTAECIVDDGALGGVTTTYVSGAEVLCHFPALPQTGAGRHTVNVRCNGAESSQVAQIEITGTTPSIKRALLRWLLTVVACLAYPDARLSALLPSAAYNHTATRIRALLRPGTGHVGAHRAGCWLNKLTTPQLWLPGTVSNDGTAIECTVPAGLAAGVYNVSVTNHINATASNSLDFTVASTRATTLPRVLFFTTLSYLLFLATKTHAGVGSTLHLVSAAPRVLLVQSGAQRVVIMGGHFLNVTSLVCVTSVPVATVFVNETCVECILPTFDHPGELSIGVSADAGHNVSNVMTIRVQGMAELPFMSQLICMACMCACMLCSSRCCCQRGRNRGQRHRRSGFLRGCRYTRR